MVFVIMLAIFGIIGMFICVLRFPSIRLKGVTIDTFYIPVLIVAIILLLFPLFQKKEFYEILFSNSTLNPLKILVLFISVSSLSIALDETGFFSVVAAKFINRYNSSQKKLFFVLYLLISILTIFTSNDVVILIFTPFILYFSKRGGINPIPYLVMEFVAANTYSMLLAIGNPTNIYLSTAFNIPFLEYFKTMLVPTALCGITSILVLYLMFKKQLKKTIQIFNIENPRIKSKFLCTVSLLHLAACTLFLTISNYIHLEMWIICLCFSVSLFIFLFSYSIYKRNIAYATSTIKRIPYSLIPFILSMFTIVMAIDSYGIFDYISVLFHNINNPKIEAIFYLISSTLSCNVLNNIPMTLSFASILSKTSDLTLVYATIIGSNLGALLTPIGALAGIMWLRILKINNVEYGFRNFMKNGAILVSVLLLASILALLII